MMKDATFEPLTDGVITLRRPTEADAEQVAALIRSSYDHITPWMVWAKPDHSVEDVLVWIRRDTDPTGHPFMVFNTEQRYVGSAGLNHIDKTNLVANIGYWLCPEATGFGYATRVANLLIRYAIEEVGAHRVEIWMSAENEPSRQVAERSYATYEATLREFLLYDGRHHDTHGYAFIKGDPIPDEQAT